MSVLTDLYQALFGKNHIQDGNVIDMAEHGRVGGVSTGQGFKFHAIVDPVSGTSPTVTNGKLDVNSAAVGGATSDNQTNGSQKTQIVDAGGEAATVTGGKLDVNAAFNTTGLATEDSLMLLRDIRKLLKASAYKDVGDRQIVKIGAVGGISGGAEVTTTMPVSGSVTATVASTTITQAGTHDSRLLNYDMARVKYSTGMRANLSFT